MEYYSRRAVYCIVVHYSRRAIYRGDTSLGRQVRVFVCQSRVGCRDPGHR